MAEDVPLVLNRFRLGAPIGNGAFGQVFVAYDTHKQDREVAIKLEKSSCKHPQLRFEAKVYQALQGQGESAPGVPKLAALTKYCWISVFKWELVYPT